MYLKSIAYGEKGKPWPGSFSEVAPSGGVPLETSARKDSADYGAGDYKV